MNSTSARRGRRPGTRSAAGGHPLRRLAAVVILSSGLGAGVPVQAQTVQPPFDANYTAVNLGVVPGLPTSYGGLTFKYDDPDTLLIGGAANSPVGEIYAIAVTRDAAGHVTGFSGTATFFTDGTNNDGGLAYGPSNVLFQTRYPVNQIAQTKLGNLAADKVTTLTSLAIANSVGALAFVPPGFPGAGQLKVLSYTGGTWHSVAFAPDGAGTYDLTSATLEATLNTGPEGVVYVPAGSPVFPDYSAILVAEYSYGRISAYTIDANGDPVVATRANFLTGLTGAEGATIDPVSGDFLFSTFGSGAHVVAVRGFAPPTVCGDGMLDEGEACDAGTANGTPGSCCTAQCTFRAAGETCRPAADSCDPAESCTGADPACPADATPPDADGDGRPDACDPCTNLFGLVAQKARISITKQTTPAGDDGLKVSGQLTVPTAPAIDPVSKGLRVLVEDADGGTILDAYVPSGAFDTATRAGWKVNRTHTVWSFENPGTRVPSVGGIVKATVKLSTKVPGLLKFVVIGKKGAYPVAGVPLPVHATIVIDAPIATAGQCGDVVFPGVSGGSCAFNASGSKLKCK